MLKEESQNSKEEAPTADTDKNARFEGIGWKIRLRQTRTNYFLTLAKEIVIGNRLRKGDDVFYYLVECEERTGILIFLDGDERPKNRHIRLKGTTFMVK